jgi:hypothetical protein
MKRFHIVGRNENLSGISKEYQVPLSDLININSIKNPNILHPGQRIMLRKSDVLGVRVIFLDKDRNAISGLFYVLEFCGKSVEGKTEADGMSKKIVTDRASDKVRILIERLDGTRKELALVESGYGNKLVTTVSENVMITAKTEKHPDSKASPPRKKDPVTPAFDPNTKQPPTDKKKDLGPVSAPVKTPDGKPLTQVEGDIPDLDLFLEKYVGGELSEEDINAAAKDLKCEPGLIFAIAKQESSSSSFFKIGSRTVPKILYERHWFRKLTKPNKKAKSPYEEKYHDICGPAYHLTTRNKKKEIIDRTTGAAPVADDIYGPQGLAQYKRLVKAYQLEKDAALQSCSWGKFQIMGFNFKAAGFATVTEFTKAMSRGDAEHMKAFLKFAKSNSTLLSGLQNKNFESIAEGHNGAEWKKINPKYASNLEAFYKEYIKSK